jgi:hypothetical protein
VSGLLASCCLGIVVVSVLWYLERRDRLFAERAVWRLVRAVRRLHLPIPDPPFPEPAGTGKAGEWPFRPRDEDTKK